MWEIGEGTLLKNKYRLERKIAQGGMSSIYLCTNIELGTKWIAKHIDNKLADFLYEEEILKKLNHISLPKIIDFCRDESGVCIIQSYIEGVSLQKKLETFGLLELEIVTDFALQLCEVMIYLHNIKPRAIIHRDLKPSNIIITEYDKLVLIDFGISAEMGRTIRSYRAGTNAYSAPEQLLSGEKNDTKADIYSFGILLHQMASGLLPGKACLTVGRKPSIIYNKLIEISEKCSRFNTDERYQRVEDVREDLLHVRDLCILKKEGNKVKRKAAVVLSVMLSFANYACFVYYLIYYNG